MAYKKFKRSFKRKYKKKPSLSRQIMRLADTKRYAFEDINSVLLHNVFYSHCPTQMITQGVTNVNRVGDSVYLQDICINGFVNALATKLCNIRLRIIVGWHTKQVAATTLTTTGLASTDIFLPATSTAITNGIVNPRSFTVLSDSVIDLNSTNSTSEDIKSFYMTIPLKHNFEYSEGAGTYGKRKNLFVCFLPHEVGAVAVTESAAAVTWSYCLKFKDP